MHRLPRLTNLLTSIAALALCAAVPAGAAPSGSPAHTVLRIDGGGAISFARSGSQIAWVDARCNVRAVDLHSRARVHTLDRYPDSGAGLGCQYGEAIGVAGGIVAWLDPVGDAHFPVDQLRVAPLVGGAVRRLDSMGNDHEGPGGHAGSIVATTTGLAYSKVIVSRRTTPAGCDAYNDPGCDFTVGGGGVFSIPATGTRRTTLVDQPAWMVAAGGGRYALVASTRGHAVTDMQVEVRAVGQAAPLLTVPVKGTVTGLALTKRLVLVRVTNGRADRVAWYRLDGTLVASVAIGPGDTGAVAEPLYAVGNLAAFQDGLRVRTIDLRSGAVHTIASVRADPHAAFAAAPIGGVVLEQTGAHTARLTWVENRRGSGLVRERQLPTG